ncbi:hypothetical protein AcW1_008269 [Taiwanofungus camphoratus]|nr:hypothetical protein AcW1_008269 [Antrodia cinnamomea]
MAPSTSAGVPSSFQDRPTTTRSNSVASTASTGGASLRRRSRTRTRTLTSAKRGKSLGPSEKSRHGLEDSGFVEPFTDKDLPPVPTLLYDEPQEIKVSSRAETSTRLAHPPRRPRTAGSERRPTAVQDSDKAVRPGKGRSGSPDFMRGRQSKSEGGSVKGFNARSRGASLPRQAFKTTVSSDSSSQPSPSTPAEAFHDASRVQVVGGGRSCFRDSVLTQISSTSSSIYPASTYTGSRTESSLPYTLDEDRDDLSSFNPEIVSPDKPEFDADDVSYRLRLLVNNNYFLPPAHAKPSPLSLASPEVTTNKRGFNKSPNSTFLDFFRIGKSKSRPTTPATRSPPAVDHNAGPVLRTTSDSTTASGYVSRPHARSSSPQTPAVPPLPHQNSMNRVVVVKERMDDLVTAAKEAEEDMKNRADGRRTRSQSTPRGKDLLDVIDPTDAVDLPPPSPGYPFAAQASAAYGLGIQDSVGAAVLAEQLPPHSPGIWSLSTEDSWRKALLHEAVSHSLSSYSPDNSFASSSGGQSALPSPTAPSSSPDSGMPARPSEVSSTSTPRNRIGQRILQEQKISSGVEQPPSPTTPTQTQSRPLSEMTLSTAFTSTPKEATHPAWHMSSSPPRAETPSETHPLAPPPRRSQIINPMYSLSEPDLPDACLREGEPSSLMSPHPSTQIVRKALSSPGLSAAPPRDVVASPQRSALSITPPPVSIHQRMSARASPAMEGACGTPSFSSYRSMMSDDDLSYATPLDTDADQAPPRPSVTISLPSEGRPSFQSEYSNASPTASAFHDALFGSYRSPSVLSRRSFTTAEGSGPPRGVSPLPAPTVASRSSVVSPPPRVSSAMGATVLPPPPRVRAIKPLYRPSLSEHGSTGELGRPSLTSTAHESFLDMSESLAASAPGQSLADRRGRPPSSLFLQIPSDDIPATIHSAPAPASPTAFFDRIQSHLDPLETSDESDEDDSPPAPSSVFESRPRAVSSHTSSSSSRAIMKLGNHSTPHFRPPSSPMQDPSPFDLVDRKQPIGNVPYSPPRGNYFSSRKRGIGNTDIPLLPFRPIPQDRSMSAGSSALRPSSSISRRPATATQAEDKAPRKQRESLQKFDGMLLQHMEDERDRIKRITSHISTSKR